MKKYIIAFFLFLFPAYIVRILLKVIRIRKYSIDKDVEIGFSLILVEELRLESGSRIGHLNFIKVKKMVHGGSIGSLNQMRGSFCVITKKHSWIRNGNKFSANPETYHDVQLILKERAAIVVNHIFDMTDSILIGEGTVIAGSGTQFWTHSFIVTKKIATGVRIDAPITIGDYCYIGSNCTLLSGVEIANEITIGAATCVSKSLNEKGCYVGQGLRFLPFDAEAKIESLGSPKLHNFIFRKDG